MTAGTVKMRSFVCFHLFPISVIEIIGGILSVGVRTNNDTTLSSIESIVNDIEDAKYTDERSSISKSL